MEASLFQFLHLMGWTLSFLILFSLAGGFFLKLIPNRAPFAILSAPMLGILIMAPSISFLYGYLAQTLELSAGLPFVIFSIITIACFYKSYPWLNIKKENIFIVCFVLILIAIIVYLKNFASISLGASHFLFIDGSDHLGYAHAAAWIQDHPGTHPIADPAHPYQTWPALMFQTDSRFGTVYILSIISQIFGESPMFSYDLCATVFLCAGMLAVTSVFSRTALAAVLLVIGLILSCWLDMANMGYLGKVAGYPAVLFVMCLILTTEQPSDLTKGAAIIALLLGMATLYPGHALSNFLIVVLGLALVGRLIFSRFALLNNMQFLKENVTQLILFTAMPLVAMGVLVAPKLLGVAADRYGWSWLMPRIFDLESLGPASTRFMPESLSLLFYISAGVGLVLMLMSYRKKDVISFAFLGYSFLMLPILVIMDKQWITYQLTSAFYPLVLCGAIYLFDTTRMKNSERGLGASSSMFEMAIVLLCILFLIGSHVPRFNGSMHRYSMRHQDDIVASLQFSSQELKNLRKTIGDSPLVVDVPATMLALPLLVQFKEDINVQWSPETWKMILGYKPWAAPILKPANKYLAINASVSKIFGLSPVSTYLKNGCHIIFSTHQYDLFNCESHGS